RADLWLSAGWPVRADRPDCRAFALRVDWEYGALPVELTPHVTQDADHVVVHSEHVRSVVAAAGRPPAGIEVVPHGVDEAMRAEAPPDPDIVRWKAGRPAVLFCGGMVWRKGFDVFLRTVLAAHAAGREIVVVVKAVGHDRHYGRNNLRALLERVVRTPGTPPVLVVERELTRSQLASLYRACDVMLHPYRGEGFCLPVLEARAVGLPVLATAGGATEAFLNGPGATRIPSTRRAIELPGAHVGQPWVLEPDADAAVRLLMAALADLPALAVSARRAVAAVRSTFSWDAAAARLEALAQRTVGGDVAAAVAVPLPLPPARPSPDQLPAVRKPAKTSVR
ncbi:MAG: glycosyltransferase family 4 protein, partial [Planctomycetes bacterium]|nr:glycosyltransferase family 4 protein [Planctomycetota bacterium]